MIDEKYQGLGYGKKAMECVMTYIKTFPCGEAKYCWLSYEPENEDAKALYSKFGFIENGDMCGDEVVAICSLWLWKTCSIDMIIGLNGSWLIKGGELWT